MATLATPPGEVLLVSGPRWASFEKFRKNGEASLDEIPERGLATLVAKRGTYKILREEDFEELFDLASELGRVQKGISVVMQAARVYARNADVEHANLLLSSIMMIANNATLGAGEGEEWLIPDPAPEPANHSDDFEWEHAAIPRAATTEINT